MSSHVVEWAPFRLAEGVTEALLLEVSESLQNEFLSHLPGFVRRELLHAGGRDWCDLVYWESAEAAQAVMDAVAASPVCHRYFGLMEGADHADPGAGVLHLSIKRTYRAGAPTESGAAAAVAG